MDKAAVSMEIARKDTLNIKGHLLRLYKNLIRAHKDEDSMITPEKRALLRELDETLYQLREARQTFERASSPEIIEAAIYEIKSAESRYGFLLRRAKQMDLKSPVGARRIVNR